jgi:hypothetical protein
VLVPPAPSGFFVLLTQEKNQKKRASQARSYSRLSRYVLYSILVCSSVLSEAAPELGQHGFALVEFVWKYFAPSCEGLGDSEYMSE